ncbi:MAG: MarR family transcriptional regulator [Sphingomonadaceae bacterium]|nr:MarR family transcriptional regulator [Sphingomonadaceae bacterium]
MGDTEKGGAQYDDAPAVAIVADSDAGLERGRRAAEAIGARTVYSGPLGEALDELKKRAAIDAVLLDVERDSGDTLDRLTAYLNEAAAAGRYRSVISAPIELIDAIEAQCSHRDITLVSAPQSVELAAELGIALSKAIPRFHDRSVERDEARLLRLSEEAGRIARALAELSRSDVRIAKRSSKLDAPSTDYRGEPPDGTALDADTIRSMIRLRRLRDRFFDGTLFADPAWDMLLDLMAARIEGRQVSVSSLCIAAAVPPTTALRWIKAMTEQALFVRNADPRDGRRVFIALDDDAAHAMETWFAAARASEDFLAV